MYIRFQGRVRNKTSSSMLGIFQLASKLRDNNELPEYARAELEEHSSWLRMHLKSPAVLEETGHHRAISWFHPRAKEPLKRVWGIKAILEEAGVIVELVKTVDPGVIIYEDGWQVVAKPRRKSK